MTGLHEAGLPEVGLHEVPHDQHAAYWDEAFEIRQRQGQQLFRMASFRLAILGMLLSSLGAVIAFALIYAAIDHTVQNTFITSVRDEQSELLADMRRNHWTLTQAVNQAIQESPDMFFTLVAKDHHPVTGNLDVPGTQLGWRKLSQLDGAPLPPGVLAIDGMTMALPGGDRLFIGRNATWLIALNTRLAYVFGGVFGVMTGLGLLASLLIAHSSLQRVRAISDASREIMAGDLSRRIKRYGRDDELDRVTDDLNAMLARMQVLVENLSQVTNDVAHDLRSPLTWLRERLELARNNPAHPQAVPAFDAALAQVDHIVGVFDALLRIAEIEASVSQAGFTAIDLGKLVEMLAEAYESVADDNVQALSVNIDEGLWIRGDRDLLIQMLINLIENSIRHCPAGTAICLSGQALAEGVELVVADDGPGVPEADRARILQRFIRLDAARHSQGNGLGLALVAAVVAMHQGSITLDDNRPGLRVRLLFPDLEAF